MSNSPLVKYTKISPNRSSPRNHVIDTITIHCVVGQCTVEALGEVFAPTSRRASSNYGIGKDGKIGMYVEEKDRSWCSSSGENDNRAITIEVASDTTHPYTVNSRAFVALLDLCTDICKRNGIKELKWKADKSLIGQVDKQNMSVHRWFANKACPGEYLYNQHSTIAEVVNKRLKPPTSTPIVPRPPSPVSPKIPTGDDNMNIQEFRKLWIAMREGLQDNDCSTWSQDARDWAISNGLMQGGNKTNGEPNYMWEDVLTREQFITVLYRFAQLMKAV